MSFVGVNDAEAYVTYDDVGNKNDMADSDIALEELEERSDYEDEDVNPDRPENKHYGPYRDFHINLNTENSKTDSDIALEELEERSDYEDEDENPDRPENKHYGPYRDFHINLNTENPNTGRAWTKKDYNKAFNDFIEKEAWQVEPPLRREELKYDLVAPGPVGTELNELAVLERFFTPALVETIVDCFNKYASSERFKSRKDIGELAKSTMTNECFWKWVLIKLQLVYYNLADTASAWSTKQLKNIPSFSKIMSRNRYQYLDSIIRCSYDTDTDDKDPLWKCRRIIDSLNKTFRNSYNLKRNISIDESFLRYSGNHSLKRYIPNKAAHFGFKYYAVADSDTADTAYAWSTKQLKNIPSFSKIMSRNRYQYLDSIIRCSYDTDTDDKDPLGKCRRIIDSLNKTFCNSYNLKRNISIDESLLRYSGNHSLKRYIPNKAAHFGFKYYAVAESDTGYVYRLLFDMGAKTKIISDCPETLSKPGKIVCTLLQGMTPSHPPLLNKGHLLATDKFYTCFYLFFALRKHGTDCIGTVRKNRASLPKSLLKKK
ncbi:hypothetical protein MP638_004423, partial [Amoeboaphelidium occidentale]